MPADVGSYSFQDVTAAVVGPGCSFAVEGTADEGVTVEFDDDKNTMTKGADGSVMHSLHAASTGTVTFRCLKTSASNALFNAAYRFQQGSSVNWGKNTITITDPVRGDLYNCSAAAFKKHTGNTYAKDGNITEWAFDVGYLKPVLGSGTTVPLSSVAAG